MSFFQKEAEQRTRDEGNLLEVEKGQGRWLWGWKK